jgi:hypothetical protein
MHSRLLQRKCACGGTPGPTGECEECRKKRLQRKPWNPEVETRNDFPVPPIVHEVLRSPGDRLDPAGRAFPLLIYPPANLNPPKVDLFVFFHGMRADYGEGEGERQGSEPIALWSHLQEAVAGTDRLGIAPQAPKTWRKWHEDIDDPENPGKKKTQKIWQPATAQWGEALANKGFDGLLKIALEGLTRDLGLSTPLVAGEIHVAGHSAGGEGIAEATSRDAGAKTFGDMVQDVTLQDAGYGGDYWAHLMDWFLDGSPEKTVRVLLSQAQGKAPEPGKPPKKPGPTRSVLTDWFNVKKINEIIKDKKRPTRLRPRRLTSRIRRTRSPGQAASSSNRSWW